MAWEFVDEAVETPTSTKSKESDSWEFVEESTSPARLIGASGREALLRSLGAIQAAFGGGEGSAMQQMQREQAERNRREEQEFARERGIEEPGEIEERSVEQLFDQATGGRLVPQTPAERITADIVGTGAEFATLGGMLPGGGTVGEGFKEGAKFGAGAGAAKEMGANPLEQLIAGVATGAAPAIMRAAQRGLDSVIQYSRNLFGKSELPEKVAFLEEAGTKQALADLKLNEKDLTGRVAKTSQAQLEEAQKLSETMAGTSAAEMQKFSAQEIENKIVAEQQGRLLDKISPAPDQKKQAWEGIQEVVEENFQAAKNAYTDLYNSVDAGAEGLRYVPKNLYDTASRQSKELGKSLLKVSEEQSVIKPMQNLRDALTDKKVQKQLDSLKRVARNEVDTDLSIVNEMMEQLESKKVKEIPVTSMLATERSLSRLLRKSDIIPSFVDLLKPLKQALKTDIDAALSKRPGLREMRQQANELFKKTQDRFNTDAMIRFREAPNPENLGRMASNASDYERIAEAVGGDKKVKSLLERMVVEEVAKKSTAAANEAARELRPYLGEEANKVLTDIRKYGNKLTNPGNQKLARENILAEAQTFVSTGKRPDGIINLMLASPMGESLVRNTLQRSNAGKQILRSVDNIIFNDLIESSIGKAGVIDYTKTADLLKNPQTRKIIRSRFGERGLNLLRNMETYGKNIEKNLRALRAEKPSLFDEIFDQYMTDSAKTALVALAPFTKGLSLVPALGKIAKDKIRNRSLMKIFESANGQEVIQELSRPNASSQATEKAIKRFAQIINRIEEQDG